VVQAYAQDVYDALNPSYKPPAAEKNLFEVKQRFMYAVFEKILQTDKGKALVRTHEKAADAQKIFDELCKDALRSTHSSIDSSRLFSYITSVRIDDGLWNGTAHIFILHWQDQVHLFESLDDTTAHFNPEQKLHRLQNVVHLLDELGQVKNQADQLQAAHGKFISYESYCNLLLSAASNYDAQFAPKGRAGHTIAKAPKRNMYAHDMADYGDDDSTSDACNLDSHIVDLIANVHKQHSKDPKFNTNGSFSKSRTSKFNRNGIFPKPCLSSQQWHSLQPEARATWDLLPDEAKAIILGLCKDPGKQAVNLHNISAYDFPSE